MRVLAACHVHSDWSYDGSCSLADLSAKFSQRGYRVLMMTEHDRGFTATRLQDYRNACAAASSDSVLVVPGIEYSDAGNRVHVLTWGPIPFLGEGLPTSELLEAVSAAQGVAVLAHPSRKSAWQCFEPAWTNKLLGIEVWNRKYDGWAPSQTAPGLSPGTSAAISFVGLDFHTQRQMFPLGMALNIESAITENTVLDSLRRGRCAAHAFGAPLSRNIFRKAMPVMRVAEHGRRTAARIARKAGVV